MDVRVSSDNSLLSHASSAVTRRRLLYLASAEDNETVTCVFDFQEIKLLQEKSQNHSQTSECVSKKPNQHHNKLRDQKWGCCSTKHPNKAHS